MSKHTKQTPPEKQPEKLAEQENSVETQPPKKKAVEPTYTTSEFSSAPGALGNYNADIVRAALTIDGKGSYTIEEAKAIVKKFSDKEVK